MTRHYTHVGELAAGRAVAALPSIMGDAATPRSQPSRVATLTKARAIAGSMTAKNWREKKAELLALTD